MSEMTQRLVTRYKSAGKGKTFAQAQDEILALLKHKGWETKLGLKIPYATSPDGKFRLWFKTQAVYFTVLGVVDEGPYPKPTATKHDFKEARTISYSLDIRSMSGEDFLATVMHWYQSRF